MQGNKHHHKQVGVYLKGECIRVDVYLPSQAGCLGEAQTDVAGEVGAGAEHSPAHYHQIMPG